MTVGAATSVLMGPWLVHLPGRAWPGPGCCRRLVAAAASSRPGPPRRAGRSPADQALADEAPADPGEEAVVRPVERRPDDEVVERTPEEREAHEPDLHEQHLAVALRPEVVQVRQPDDARGRSRRTSTSAISTGREPREADERLRRSCGAPNQSRPAIVASPPIQSDAAEMCTQSAISVFHDEPGSTASCPDTRGRRRRAARARTPARAARPGRAATPGRRARARARSRAS